MDKDKQLESLRKFLYNIEYPKGLNSIEYQLLASKRTAKRILAAKFLKELIFNQENEENYIPSRCLEFLHNTILENKTIAYIKMLCKIIDNSHIKFSDFNGTEVRIISTNHIHHKSVKVYSKILRNMIDKELNKSYIPSLFTSIERIFEAIYFCSQYYEYYKEVQQLPFYQNTGDNSDGKEF